MKRRSIVCQKCAEFSKQSLVDQQFSTHGPSVVFRSISSLPIIRPGSMPTADITFYEPISHSYYVKSRFDRGRVGVMGGH